MKRVRTPDRRTPAWCWLVLLILAAAVLPGRHFMIGADRANAEQTASEKSRGETLAVDRAKEGAGAPAAAQDPNIQEIRQVLQRYFDSIARRDSEGIKKVVTTTLMGIEAGRQVKVHILDSERPDKLLPPPGNDDFKNVRISEFSVQVSSTHPSVAMASFVLVLPLTAKQVAQYQQMLNKAGPEFDMKMKELLAKMIRDKAYSASMFALMAKQRDKWRVACMTVPK